MKHTNAEPRSKPMSERAISAAEILREIQRNPHRVVKDVASVFNVPTNRFYRMMYKAGIRIRQCRAPVVCSCGTRLKHPNKSHLRSTLHRNNKRLLKLLRKFIPHGKIGKRVGISRERVRQIAKILAIKPTKAHLEACAFERFKKRRPTLAAVAAELRRKGLQVEPTCVNNVWSGSVLMVNGRRCAIMKATRICSNGLEYLQVGPCCKDAAFTLRRTPYGWLVLPKNSVTNCTMFVLGRRKLNGAGGPKRDWERCLEAWHLLAPAKRSGAVHLMLAENRGEPGRRRYGTSRTR
jgi:hypothetical protein